MRFRDAFLLVWLGLCTWGAAYGAGAADAILSEVSAALAAGQYPDVVTVAANGLAEPDLEGLTRARLLIVRGLARQALGANEEALADFTDGLAVTSLPPQERARALFARGVSLDSLERLDDAVGDYSAVLKLVPGAPYALNNRANVRRRQGRLEEARRDYLAALGSANSNPQYPYFGLGQIAEARGDLPAARGYYNRALAASPGFPLALERLRAMGAPVEGPAGLPADTGMIVLKPPAKAQSVIVLHPSEKPPAPIPVAAGRAAPHVEAPPGQGAPLRPPIVDSVPSAAMVQLGAWRSEAEAQQGWAVARSEAGGLLDGLSPQIVRAEIPGRGTYYRLRVSPHPPVPQFCAMLLREGVACIPVRNMPP